MKRTMGMAAAFVCAAAFSAQAQSPTAAEKRSSADKPSDVITVSGCLQSGQSSSATANNNSAMGSYVLMTTVMSGSSAGAAAGGTTAGTSGTTVGATGSTATTGTTASTGTTGTTEAGRMSDSSKMAHPGASYMLDGKDSELKNHVGHRVEVTGTVAGSMSGMNHGSTASPSTSTSGTASDHMATANQTLKVASIKMISTDCAAK